MLENHKEWKFGTLIDKYFELSTCFRKKGLLNNFPWSLQVEMNRVTSVLNAFTDGNYNAETLQGRREIVDAFEQGFGLQHKLCTEEQLVQLQILFPLLEEFFPEFDNESLQIGDLYRYLFTIYQASYNYITIFDGLSDDMVDTFRIVNSFKRKDIDSHIILKCRIIYKAMKILLGEMSKQAFTTFDLIDKYGYPDVNDEKLVTYNRKWCKFYRIKFEDYRKSRSEMISRII